MARALVLMSRLSDYMLHCMQAWHEATGVDIHIVRRDVDGAAPFQFDTVATGLSLYRREDLDRSGLKDLARRLDPSLILCFGWADRDYLAMVRARPARCTAVMTMDNQWLGTARQYAGLLWSRIALSTLFDHVWVPGSRQQQFARKLGFAEERTHKGLYVANDQNFDPIWQDLDGEPPARRLIFVGRYSPEKGLQALWDAFCDYCAQSGSKLELWCVGTGPLDAHKPDHPQIRHLGFVQPRDFAERLKGGGVFVLPSHFEPWGLVVQEFALAGCPLIISRHVGAVEAFLGDDNGFLLATVDRNHLIDAMAQIDAASDSQLCSMARASRLRAQQLTVAHWTDQAQAFLTPTV